MQRHGRTVAGTPRWICPECRTTGVRKRKDNRARARLSLFAAWLTGKATLEDVAKRRSVSVRSVSRWFSPLWSRSPSPRIPRHAIRTLVLDATSVSPRTCMLLIAGDGDRKKPVFWRPAVRECYEAWRSFLARLATACPAPSFVVCDGQRGLLKAIREVWPFCRVQRCLIHVIRQAVVWTTQRPKTKAGRELLVMLRELSAIRTRRQKRRWIRAFKQWKRKHWAFLTERTEGPNGRWWYTHRKLRAVRSLITNAIPDLFCFVSDPTIPRTSNHVEGGLNARLKELFRCHRGITVSKKLAVASWYLSLRQRENPTRNVY